MISAFNEYVTHFVTDNNYLFHTEKSNYKQVFKKNQNITLYISLSVCPCLGSALCSPVPMFPGTYVPRTYVPRYLCSPVPMFPGTDVPRTYVPRYLCSPNLCSPVPMFPDLVQMCCRAYMGICQKKLHIGFSKYSKFKRVIILVLMTFCVCEQ